MSFLPLCYNQNVPEGHPLLLRLSSSSLQDKLCIPLARLSIGWVSLDHYSLLANQNQCPN